jgi:hypothetical protein
LVVKSPIAATTPAPRPQLVDGLLLGIDLAAAWVSTLACAKIAQEIERNLDFLAASAR